MIDLFRHHPLAVLISAFVLGAVAVAAVWGIAAAASRPESRPTAGVPSTDISGSPDASGVASPLPTSSAPASSADCSAATTTVDSADGLSSALAHAGPGDVIAMTAGRYDGNFVATASGSADRPITLCGGVDAVLDGGSTEKGYVFHLDHASYWRLEGFSVTDGQKGVMADGTVGSVIAGLTVSRIGDEAIHLRNFSTDNTVTGNTVSDTGHRRGQFGEGIYIGTATSNWCDITNCRPDASDRNLIENNRISDTTAENVDIKEGTTGGVLRGNSFDGVGMTSADSWVDVKGNGWTIEGNTGRTSPGDGFQVHDVAKGWGTDNVFRSNTAAVDGPGFGFHLAPVQQNVVLCSNTASGAAEGLSNVRCTSG